MSLSLFRRELPLIRWDTQNRDREKSSGKAKLLKIWTTWAMDRTSSQTVFCTVTLSVSGFNPSILWVTVESAGGQMKQFWKKCFKKIPFDCLFNKEQDNFKISSMHMYRQRCFKLLSQNILFFLVHLKQQRGGCRRYIRTMSLKTAILLKRS